MRSKSHHNQPEIAISMVTNPEINNKRKGREDEARTKNWSPGMKHLWLCESKLDPRKACFRISSAVCEWVIEAARWPDGTIYFYSSEFKLVSN